MWQRIEIVGRAFRPGGRDPSWPPAEGAAIDNQISRTTALPNPYNTGVRAGARPRPGGDNNSAAADAHEPSRRMRTGSKLGSFSAPGTLDLGELGADRLESHSIDDCPAWRGAEVMR